MPMSKRLLRPKRSSGFRPTSLPGLSLWLDASDSSTLFQDAAATTPATATNDPVGAWLDKSGNGRHATQATAGNRPVISGTLVGARRGLSMTGTQSLMTGGPNLSLSQPTTIFAVIRTGTSAQSGTILDFSNNPRQILTWDGGSGTCRAWAGAGFIVTGGAQPLTATSMIVAFNGSASRAAVNSRSFWAFGNPGINGTAAGAVLGNWTTFDQPLRGQIAELGIYNRMLSDSEVDRLNSYLASKYAIAFAPQASNADAQNWINRVYANGGTVSASTAAAVNAFCNAIDAAGIRDRFYRLNLMCGTGLNACLVPLYRGTSLTGSQLSDLVDTNVGPFVTADYTETGSSGGLSGDGAVKRLTMAAIASSAISAADSHMSVYASWPSTDTGDRALIGTRPPTADLRHLQLWTATSSVPMNRAFVGNSASPADGSPVASQGHIVASATSATDLRVFVGGAQTGIQTANRGSNVLAASTPMYVWSSWSNGLVYPNGPSSGRIAAYSYGFGMTPAQVSAYYSAMQTFQTALSRQL